VKTIQFQPQRYTSTSGSLQFRGYATTKQKDPTSLGFTMEPRMKDSTQAQKMRVLVWLHSFKTPERFGNPSHCQRWKGCSLFLRDISFLYIAKRLDAVFSAKIERAQDQAVRRFAASHHVVRRVHTHPSLKSAALIISPCFGFNVQNSNVDAVTATSLENHTHVCGEFRRDEQRSFNQSILCTTTEETSHDT
jgi:hypothetical protein